MKRGKIPMLLMLFVLFKPTASPFDFTNIKEKVSEFTLSNGLKFILIEDHSVPILDLVIFANVGTGDERKGQFGISHFLEHMAFKGTPEVGTKDYAKEKKIFKKMDRVFNQILREKQGGKANEQRIKKLQTKLAKLKEKVGQYVISNEYDAIFKKHGAINNNAGTANDFTTYFMSLPSNKIELWAYLESSRFVNPVFREFYKEKEVIKEERRMRIDNNPLGKMLFEIVPRLAFLKDHPYRESGIGTLDEIEGITRGAMIKYFRRNYTARNMVVGVHGDITLEALKKIAGKYFSKIKEGKKNQPLKIKKSSLGHGENTIYEKSQPMIFIGFHGPSAGQPDYLKMGLLDYIVTKGRSSILYKKLVSKDKIAMDVDSYIGYPGAKYPSLILFAAMPNTGHTNQEIRRIILATIETLKANPVSQEELTSAKVRLKTDMLRQIKEPRFLLQNFLIYEMMLGGWKKVFDSYVRLEEINTSDIREVANRYFRTENRIIVNLETQKEKSNEF